MLNLPVQLGDHSLGIVFYSGVNAQQFALFAMSLPFDGQFASYADCDADCSNKFREQPTGRIGLSAKRLGV